MTTAALVFILAWSIGLTGLFVVLFRVLPGARWQFIAAVPGRPRGGGEYQGRNLTWYGFFTATSIVYALSLFTALSLAAGAEILQTALFGVLILAIAIPCAKIVAAIVEKRKGTITVAGAAFPALLLAPPASLVLPHLGRADITPGMMLAALSIAYVAGEGFGRLACLSFGCCYGRRADEFGPRAQKLLQVFGQRFYGHLKKASYEGQREGELLFPIQAVNAVVYSVIAVGAASLFLSGFYLLSFLIAVGLGFGWRFVSEFLRSDFRGDARISAYQYMSLAAVAYCLFAGLFIDFSSPVAPDILLAGAIFRDARFLLGIQALWVACFVYLGVSSVTRSEIRFSSCLHELSTSKKEPNRESSASSARQPAAQPPVISVR